MIQKKIYFCDPMIYWLAVDWAGIKPPENVNDALAEMCAHEWLSQRFKRMGYYSNTKGEIDFVNSDKLAIEVKWASVAKNLSRTYKDFHSPFKTTWTQQTMFELA